MLLQFTDLDTSIKGTTKRDVHPEERLNRPYIEGVQDQTELIDRMTRRAIQSFVGDQGSREEKVLDFRLVREVKKNWKANAD